MRCHPRHREARIGRRRRILVVAVIIAPAPVGIGHDRLAPDLVKGDVLRAVLGRRGNDQRCGHPVGEMRRPAERLHPAHRPADDRVQPRDAEMVEQQGLAPRHVADRHDRKAHRIGFAILCHRLRPRRPHAPANRIDRNHAEPVGIDWPARPDHPRPPAGFAGNRMHRGDMLVAGQRVADENCVRCVGVERAIAFIGEFDRRQHAPAVERERPGQCHMAIVAETIIHRLRLCRAQWRDARFTGSCSARSSSATYARWAIRRNRALRRERGNCGR